MKQREEFSEDDEKTIRRERFKRRKGSRHTEEDSFNVKRERYKRKHNTDYKDLLDEDWNELD